MHVHRSRGHTSRHGRVPVAIAADPAAEAQEWSGERRALRGTRRAQRAVHRPEQLGHDSKQGLVENRHERAHLVERRDAERAYLRRPPQRVDLLDEPSLRVALFAVGDPRIVQPLELIADAPDGRDHRPAPSLGRVRCEDGVDLERLDQTVESLRTQLGSKLADRRGQRLGHWLRSAVAFADDARTMVFLSEVGQMEIARERARHLLGAIESP